MKRSRGQNFGSVQNDLGRVSVSETFSAEHSVKKIRRWNASNVRNSRCILNEGVMDNWKYAFLSLRVGWDSWKRRRNSLSRRWNAAEELQQEALVRLFPSLFAQAWVQDSGQPQLPSSWISSSLLGVEKNALGGITFNTSLLLCSWQELRKWSQARNVVNETHIFGKLVKHLTQVMSSNPTHWEGLFVRLKLYNALPLETRVLLGDSQL